MSETVERAQEGIEEAHHAAEHERVSSARYIAVLIAILAAALAIAELGEKAAQNAYLTHHIALSDDWNFYQAKRIRSTAYITAAEVLASLPGAAGDTAIQKRIADAKASSARLEDDPKGGEGAKQLMDRARHQEELRDHEFHRYHHYELVVGGLQIAIVLASVSVVTRVLLLALGGGALGLASIIYGLTIWAGLV